MLGVDKIYKWAQKLGMAGKTGIDLPNEQESLVPNTEWKLKRTGERWYPGETISVSIGQGQVSVTPASLAVMISTVANGGTRVTPHVIKADRRRRRMEAGAGAGGGRQGRVQARYARRAPRGPVDGGERERHRRRAGRSRDATCPARRERRR